MKNCEGCPFYDKKMTRIAAGDEFRQKIIDISAGTAHLMRGAIEGTISDEEFDELQAGGHEEFKRRAEELADEGRADMIDAFAQLPQMADAHFGSLDEINADVAQAEADIERRQETCEGPVPEEEQGSDHIGPLVLRCSGVPDPEAL